jgi:hypothetical protein
MAQAGCIKEKQYRRLLGLALFIAMTLLALPGRATAELTGQYAKFSNCPFTNPEALKCVYSKTEGGEVVLGSKKVSIINPVVLQGAYTEGDVNGVSKFIAATDGVTLSKASQPVSGGLAGIVSPPDSAPLVKTIVAALFNNGLTGVSATLELARPASEILVNENNLGGEIDTALKLPVKVHLENPFLGESCYLGSARAPIFWNLTSGTTEPPAPGKPISGTAGSIEAIDGGRIFATKGTKLVGNSWAAPTANGCGGALSFLINPIVDSALRLPLPGGRNAAILVNAVHLVPATTVKEEEAEGS